MAGPFLRLIDITDVIFATYPVEKRRQRRGIFGRALIGRFAGSSVTVQTSVDTKLWPRRRFIEITHTGNRNLSHSFSTRFFFAAIPNRTSYRVACNYHFSWTGSVHTLSLECDTVLARIVLLFDQTGRIVHLGRYYWPSFMTNTIFLHTAPEKFAWDWFFCVNLTQQWSYGELFEQVRSNFTVSTILHWNYGSYSFLPFITCT